GKPQVGHVERLGINLAINRKREQYPKAARTYIGCIQPGFTEIRAGPSVVVVLGEHVDGLGINCRGYRECDCEAGEYFREKLDVSSHWNPSGLSNPIWEKVGNRGGTRLLMRAVVNVEPALLAQFTQSHRQSVRARRCEHLRHPKGMRRRDHVAG